MMEITVKQLKEALNKIDNYNEKVDVEADDIHICYDVVLLENNMAILCSDGYWQLMIEK